MIDFSLFESDTLAPTCEHGVELTESHDSDPFAMWEMDARNCDECATIVSITNV